MDEYQVILRLNEGCSVKEITTTVGCVRATMYRTLYRFEEQGEGGLADRRLGRPRWKVTPELEAQLLSYLDQSPRKLGWQRSTWTLELLALQLERDTSVKLSASHVHNF